MPKQGLLDLLNEMNTKLEEIQKSLDMYLETKRQFFPRFYFLSNDDLLEILGQSKNPEAVQPHMKKCFDNIKSLDLAKMRDHFEATHMNSAEGEKVDFKSVIRLEGPVEVNCIVLLVKGIKVYSIPDSFPFHTHFLVCILNSNYTLHDCSL